MHVLRNILGGSRYLIIIAVLGTLVASITVLIYGAITVINVLIHIFFMNNLFTTDQVKLVAFSTVELIDLFLLSTILYIISLGLYTLFIDTKLPLPIWLTIADLDDLKGRILGVIMVLLTISFLGFVVEWHFGDYSIVALGVSIGLVLFALGYLLSSSAIHRTLTHTSRTNHGDKLEDSVEKDT
jgi:uncharacterized membrane protein YqhA